MHASSALRPTLWFSSGTPGRAMPANGESDDELTERAQRGDTAAWGPLIARHHRRVLLTLLARGVRANRAEEIVQETWARLIAKSKEGSLPRLELPGLAIVQALHYSLDDARTQMWKALQTSQAKALLVYVHGYNMSFDETATRAAQLAYDLDFPGLPFFFSWPSAGKLLGYLRDADSARLSERAKGTPARPPSP